MDELTDRVSVCRACPRLVTWREEVAAEKRAAFRDEDYWGRPVPGWGPDNAQIAIVGLAPAAHGATGPGGSSPATAAATGCSPRCTAPASPGCRSRSQPTTVRSC